MLSEALSTRYLIRPACTIPYYLKGSQRGVVFQLQKDVACLTNCDNTEMGNYKERRMPSFYQLTMNNFFS